MNIQETSVISIGKESIAYHKLGIYDWTVVERLEKIGYSVRCFVDYLDVEGDEGMFKLPKADRTNMIDRRITTSECLLDGINQNISTLPLDATGARISDIQVPQVLQMITNEYIDIILIMQREQEVHLIDRDIRDIVVKIA